MDGDEANFMETAVSELRLMLQLPPDEIVRKIYELLLLPGNYLIDQLLLSSLTATNYVAQSSPDLRNIAAAILSAAVWITVLVVIKTAYDFIRELDRIMTAWFRRLVLGTFSVVNAVRRTLVYQFRHLNPRTWFSGISREAINELSELDDFEMAILRSHADVAPGYAMTAIDIGDGLKVRRWEAQEALDRLKVLGLIDGTMSTNDGHPAYRLSTTGRAFLDAFSGKTAAVT